MAEIYQVYSDLDCFKVNSYTTKTEHSKLKDFASLQKGRPLQQKRISSTGP